MYRLLIYTILSVFASTLASAQGHMIVPGAWHGELSIGMQKLPLVFYLPDTKGNNLKASLSSPLQGAKDIPAVASISSDSISVNIPSLGATFSGKISGQESISGVFRQSGMEFPLNLAPGEYVMPRPQTPTPPFPYTVTEVEFVNPADSTVLHGTLTLPLDCVMPHIKNVPAVVMVTGSGLQNRDEELGGHKPFAVLAHHLALNGIASLRYDDRGWGDPSFDHSNDTDSIYTTDALAAAEFIRLNVPKLSKTGVLGHSAGAIAAFELASEGKADFAISLSGSAMRGDSILLDQNYKFMRQSLGKDMAAKYCQALKGVLEYMEQNPQAKSWPQMAVELPVIKELIAPLQDNLQQIIASRNSWLDYFLVNDPARYISKIQVPVLAIGGSMDMQVDADKNLNAIKKLLPPHEKSLIKEYPGLNHLLQNCRTGLPDEYTLIEETISPEVLSDIAKWIKTNF